MSFMNVQLVLPCKIAFGETEVMNGIEQVGLAHAVPSANAHNAFREREFLVKIIFELVERYGVKDEWQGEKSKLKGS
jgi:hypothetical protein